MLVLPVYAEDLSLTNANPSFNYRVATLSLEATGNEPGFSGAISGKVDETPRLAYNAAQPGIDTTDGIAGAPAYQDLPGEQIPLKYNPAAFIAAKSKGILLFHHHNQKGARVQVVATPWGVLYLPGIKR